MGLSQRIVFSTSIFPESIDILSCESLIHYSHCHSCVDDYRRVSSFLLLALGQHIRAREHDGVMKITTIDHNLFSSFDFNIKPFKV